MNIEDMSDQQKSALLARAMKESMLPGKYLPAMSPEFKPINLYLPANMALAKKVIEWGAESIPVFADTLNLIAYAAWTKPDGVRLLLDEIIQAIEAGIFEATVII